MIFGKIKNMKHLHDLSICAKYVNMTDINSKLDPVEHHQTTCSFKEHGVKFDPNAILDLMELFYFAYRDFTTDGDEVLAKIGYGRAHHRVVHFVHHYPGLRVADLLNILKITKQSLARVLKQLIDDGYICQKPGDKDRRERLLYTTSKGQDLAHRLSAPQIERFIRAIAPLTPSDQKIIENFLYALIEEHHRRDVISRLSLNDQPAQNLDHEER